MDRVRHARQPRAIAAGCIEFTRNPYGPEIAQRSRVDGVHGLGQLPGALRVVRNLGWVNGASSPYPSLRWSFKLHPNSPAGIARRMLGCRVYKGALVKNTVPSLG